MFGKITSQKPLVIDKIYLKRFLLELVDKEQSLKDRLYPTSISLIDLHEFPKKLERNIQISVNKLKFQIKISVQGETLLVELYSNLGNIVLTGIIKGATDTILEDIFTVDIPDEANSVKILSFVTEQVNDIREELSAILLRNI